MPSQRKVATYTDTFSSSLYRLSLDIAAQQQKELKWCTSFHFPLFPFPLYVWLPNYFSCWNFTVCFLHKLLNTNTDLRVKRYVFCCYKNQSSMSKEQGPHGDSRFNSIMNHGLHKVKCWYSQTVLSASKITIITPCFPSNVCRAFITW